MKPELIIHDKYSELNNRLITENNKISPNLEKIQELVTKLETLAWVLKD